MPQVKFLLATHATGYRLESWKDRSTLIPIIVKFIGTTKICGNEFKCTKISNQMLHILYTQSALHTKLISRFY